MLLTERAAAHGEAVAVVCASGSFTYADLRRHSSGAAARLLDGRTDLEGARVALLAPPSYAWVVSQWGIWRAGGIAVPLCVTHPVPELETVLEDSGAQTVVVAAELRERLGDLPQRLGLQVVEVAELFGAAGGVVLPELSSPGRAMIVYTSGSTGRPKGVVSTHANIAAQIGSLVEAWEWRQEDRILEVLPLHHVHGIVNVVSCALWSGAACEMMPRFDAAAVWRRLGSGELTLFMAVPTIYVRLIRAWEEAQPAEREGWSRGARALRLMVSGSAALPVSVLERWHQITGHSLLERYGMTETGMILSNPLDGERRPGFVGTPLPRVEVRLRGEDRSLSTTEGEVEVRGPGVFREYWQRPDATTESFTDDGWFRTGDVAVVEDGDYRLLGRKSVDILKTGGYKVSALEIEEVLRRHPVIEECAVVGIPDEEWGERVGAAIVCRDGRRLELEELRLWARERLAPYKVPTRLIGVEALPRNPLGKVTKPEVVRLFERTGSGA
jgi:malonyl-CoA/methylmalonyl-CoA synthetase